MNLLPPDLQVWTSWVCKKLFLIRHENLSGPESTPRQFPGNRRPYLNDGPVPTPDGVQAHFRPPFLRASVYLVHLRFFFRPITKFARPSFAVFFSSGCGRALRVLRASFSGLFWAPFPSLYPPFFVPACRHAWGVVSRFSSFTFFTRRTLAESFEVLSRSLPLGSIPRGC